MALGAPVKPVASTGLIGCEASGCLTDSSVILALAYPPPPPPECGSLDGDLQRLFSISGLLYHHFSR
jgi:hypothetical protein